MAIERNIVFIYPLDKTLKELKESLEEDEQFMVYELDAVGEYSQLIGVLEHSMTFSSDLKKTEQYLELSKNFVKSKESRNILIQENKMMPHLFTKYQKLGLNEIIMQGTPIKNITHKIEMFFSVFEQMEKRKEEAKQKELAAKMMAQNHFPHEKSKPEVYNKNEKLRVEKMASLADTPIGEGKKNSSGLSFSEDQGGMLSGKSGFQFNSPFDQLQRKNVKTFDPQTKGMDYKKLNFELPDVEIGRKKGVEFNEVEQEKKKRKKSDLNPAELESKRKKFEEVEREQNSRRAKFEEVEREINKKNINFKARENDLKKKKGLDLNNADNNSGKKKNFTPIERELDQKRAKFEEAQRNLNKKKLDLEEIDQELKKKRKFLENELDLEKKNGLVLDIEELNRKKNKKFDEYEEELEKNKKSLEELEDEHEKAKSFDEIEIDKEQSKSDLEVEEENKKNKKKSLDDLDQETKKKSSFEELEQENNKKGSFVESESDNQKKHTALEEIDLEKKSKNIAITDIETEKKNHRTQALDLDGKERDVQEIQTIENIIKGQEFLDLNELGVLKEQTLNYGEFRKQKKAGKLNLDEEKLNFLEKKATEALLEIPEPNYFLNDSFGLEYLVLYNDLLLREKIQTTQLIKFIHFALIKEYQGDFSLYMKKKSGSDLNLISDFKYLYHGHATSKIIYNEEEWDQLSSDFGDEWGSINLPTWKDETYQIDINEFIYPFFEDGILLGFAIAHFKKGSIQTHGEAKEVEALLMSLKGAVLEENFFIKEGG